MRTTLTTTIITACIISLSPAASADAEKCKTCESKVSATTPAKGHNTAELAARTKAVEHLSQQLATQRSKVSALPK